MPDRGEFGSYLDEALTYPNIRSKAHPDGHDYRVPQPDIKTGLWLASIGETAALSSMGVSVSPEDMAKLKLNAEQEVTLQQIVLGPAHDEMIADEVPYPTFKAIFTDAFLFHAVSPELADAMRVNRAQDGQAGEGPKAPSTTRTPRKTAGSKSKKASTGTRGRTRNRTSTSSLKKTQTGPDAAPQAKAG